MTSIDTARRKFRLAIVLQLLVFAHAVLAMFYAEAGEVLYAAILMAIIVVISYAAISTAFEAGTNWPTGRRDNDA